MLSPVSLSLKLFEKQGHKSFNLNIRYDKRAAEGNTFLANLQGQHQSLIESKVETCRIGVMISSMYQLQPHKKLHLKAYLYISRISSFDQLCRASLI